MRSVNDVFRIQMPCGIERTYDNKWIPFNRNYKPLGC